MSAIDTLIANATSRANSFAYATDKTATDLQSFIADHPISITIPTLDLTRVALPTYVSPTKDATGMPVYEPPTSPIPSAPNLADISQVVAPAARAEPTLNFAGLFQQVVPSSNIPSFNEAQPDLHIDALVAEMNGIAGPLLQEINIPVLTPMDIGVAPALFIPTFDAPRSIEAIADPANYSAAMDAKYQQMVPEMQGYIDDKLATWVTQYAPEYNDWSAAMQTKVSSALEGEVLPAQYEGAMMTRARGRVERELDALEQGTLSTYAKRGFMEPPGAVVSAMLTGRLKGAETLANQSTDIYLKKTDVEVQHMQFVMNLAASQIQSTRSIAIQYAGTVSNTLQQAAVYASNSADKMAKVFEHLLGRSELDVKVLSVLTTQYEVKLKAALAGLDGYKLQLEAEKLKKDVEIAQIQFVEGQVKVQELQVSTYSALIEAISRKATLEELKLKGYQTRAEIYKATIQAQVSGFEIYRASIEGDKAKMEAEMTKLTVFEDLLKVDQINLETQVKTIDATKAHNDALVDIFKSGAEVYKLDAETALQKFSAYAEVKKLSQTIYSAELSNAIESFKAGLEVPLVKLNAVVKQYELQVQTVIEQAKLGLQSLSLSEDAAKAVVGAYGNMAGAALGSLNTMASSAISAAA